MVIDPVTTGAVVSTIVKVASSVIELLLASVRVKVTVSVPVAPQSSLKPELLFVTVTLEQLSVPVKVLFNQSLNSVVFPDPSQLTVKSLGAFVQVGSILSATVIVVVQVELLPLSSVTVSVTVLVPTLLQSKLLGLIAKVKSLSAVQLSVDPLLICAVVIVAAPLASNSTVKSAAQVAVGASLSVTVTVKVAVVTFA